jgi:hypothetical protein
MHDYGEKKIFNAILVIIPIIKIVVSSHLLLPRFGWVCYMYAIEIESEENIL